MFVHVLADTSARVAAVKALLASEHELTFEVLGSVGKRWDECHALVVKVDLHDPCAIVALRTTLSAMADVQRRIFLLDQAPRLNTAQPYAWGATHVLTGVVNQHKLLSLRHAKSSPTEKTDNEPAA